MRVLYEVGGQQVVDSLAEAGRVYGPDGRTALTPAQVPLTKALTGDHIDGEQINVRAADGRWRRFVTNADRPTVVLTVTDGPDGDRRS